MIIHVRLTLKQPLINCSSLGHTLDQITQHWHTQTSRGGVVLCVCVYALCVRQRGRDGGSRRDKRHWHSTWSSLTTDNGGKRVCMVFYRNQRFHSWRSRGWAAVAVTGEGWGGGRAGCEEEGGWRAEGEGGKKGGGEVINSESGLDAPRRR